MHLVFRQSTFEIQDDFLSKSSFFYLPISNQEKVVDLTEAENFSLELLEELKALSEIKNYGEFRRRYQEYLPSAIIKIVEFLEFLGLEEPLKMLRDLILEKIENGLDEYLITNKPDIEFNQKEREDIANWLKVFAFEDFTIL
jgi:hypothetical protein